MFGSDEKILPFRGYFFINHTVSPVFECLYLFNITAGGFGGSMIAGATGFNLVVIMHGSAKFAVLRRRLERLDGEDSNSTDVLRNYVIRHQEAIECASVFLPVNLHLNPLLAERGRKIVSRVDQLPI